MGRKWNIDPGEWNALTDHLSLEQEAALFRICNAITIADGPIANNKFVLCGLLRCNERKAKRIVSELIHSNMIWLEGEKIHNSLALAAVSKRNLIAKKRKSIGNRGGIESGKVRAKSLKNKESGEANGEAIASGLLHHLLPHARALDRSNKTNNLDINLDPPPCIPPPSKPKKRATRIPEGWQLSEKDIRFAQERDFSDEEIRNEHTAFVNWWTGASGKNSTSPDWSAKWRTWILNSVRWRLQSHPSKAQPSKAQQRRSEVERFKRKVAERHGASRQKQSQQELIGLGSGDGTDGSTSGR